MTVLRFGSRTDRPNRHRSRLHLEPLEDRCVPSTVTNLTDHDPGSLGDAVATTPWNRQPLSAVSTISRGRPPNQQRRYLIAKLRGQGLSLGEIGARLGISRQAVHVYLKPAIPIRCGTCGREIGRRYRAERCDTSVLCPACLPRHATFGQRLRAYRLAAGLTQRALASQAGLSGIAVGAYERGKQPRKQNRAKLVRILGAGLVDMAPESGGPRSGARWRSTGMARPSRGNSESQLTPRQVKAYIKAREDEVRAQVQAAASPAIKKIKALSDRLSSKEQLTLFYLYFTDRKSGVGELIWRLIRVGMVKAAYLESRAGIAPQDIDPEELLTTEATTSR